MSDSTGGGGAMSGVGWTLGAVGALAVGAALGRTQVEMR